jgi:uncharacterized protein YbjT (DUF2867 family)
MNSRRSVFVTGGTGYLGRPLIERQLAGGHEVRALTRAESKAKLPSGCIPIVGDALDSTTYADHIRPSETFVQLVGVSHPSPAKTKQFREIDLVSASGAIDAAAHAGVRHFVYLSVARPAPMMKAYIQVRAECERKIQDSGMNATILRPWYVLGPGHRWPYILVPIYRLMEILPPTRKGALRLGLVTHAQMVQALVDSVEEPTTGTRVVEVPEIRSGRAVSPPAQPAANA